MDAMQSPRKLFLDALEAGRLLGESKTLFHSPRGSRHHPLFPQPIRRAGRKPVWYLPDIERFAEQVAAQAHALTDAPPTT